MTFAFVFGYRLLRMGPTLQSALRLNQRAMLYAWIVLGFAILFYAQLCSTIWAFANPMPHHWDNAEYLNQAFGDVWAYRNKGLVGEWDGLMNTDPRRPPAYRMVSLPFVFLGTQMLPTLRAVSLILFWLSLYVIYRTGAIAIDGPPGKISGILAAILLGIYSEVGWSIRVYGTEHPLYFSVALMLYCLARATRGVGNTPFTWIGLGFALGLGALSKISFVLLAGPAIAVAVVLMIIGRLPGLSWWKLCVAVIVATLMGWPFYHLHLSEAYQYGQDMTQFQRHSLHKTGFSLLRAWFTLHIHEGLGVGAAEIVGGVMLLAAIAFLVKWVWRVWTCRAYRIEIGPSGSTILMSLAMGLPLPIFQLLFASSDNVRHMTPAYFPLTIALTLVAASTGVLASWWCWPVLIGCALPAYAQVRQEYVPMTLYPDDVWDWEPVYQAAQQHHLRFPMIGHVGNTSQFCDPTIVYPWAKRGAWANSLWLWRSEEGAYDPAKVHEKLADRDLVVTAPDFHMPASQSMLADPVELDNSHNAEFADAMLHDPQWTLAGKFSTGSVNHAEIWIFVRIGK